MMNVATPSHTSTTSGVMYTSMMMSHTYAKSEATPVM